MKAYKTIFYQGIYNSQVQLAKYLNSKIGFTATTGEKVTCTEGLDLINYPYIGQEIDEIELYEPKWSNWLNPFKLFSYIFTYLGFWYNSIHIDNSIHIEKNDEGAKSVSKHFIRLWKFNFGQEADLANHYHKYISCVNEYPEHNLILWGVSKGAATTLNSLAKNNYDNSRIKMVVLEGCFSNIEDVFTHWVQNRSYLDSNFWLAKLFLFLLKYNLLHFIISYHSRPDYHPINAVKDLPHNIPIVFITSIIDTVVPAAQTIQLYDNLVASGHPNVHLLVLKNSRHHAYMFDDADDRKAYEEFMKGLYGKYNLCE
jgi:hypothetical protein